MLQIGKLCFGYEHELRKEATRLVTECGASIQSAWWQAHQNDHHRMENWQTFLRLDSNSSDGSKDRKIEKLEREMAELRRAVTNQRSRSPRRGANQSRQLSLLGPSQLVAKVLERESKKQAEVVERQLMDSSGRASMARSHHSQL